MTPKQHKRPCNDCAFRRGSVPGKLGGSPTSTYVGQSVGPFWVPCHLHTNYDDPNWKSDLSKPQCAGMAVFRANLAVRPVPGLLQAEQDFETVFSSHEEFVAHHDQISIQEAEGRLRQKTPVDHLRDEMLKSSVKTHLIERK